MSKSLQFPRVLIMLFAVILFAAWPSLAGDEKKKSTKDDAKQEAKEAPAKPAEKSIFADRKLEEAVRPYVFEKRNNDKPITAEDVRDISVIEARDAGITDLSGLEHCVALASLDLAGNKVKDISALKGMERLQMLILTNNQVEDITPLAGLEGLQYIDLTGNRVADIAPLEKLTNLNTLYLSGNRISDISPVAEHDRLWSLYLDGNPIASLDPVSTCDRLSTLSVKGAGVIDLKPVMALTDLKFLFLQDNKIKNLGPLVRMARKDAEGERRFSPYWQIYVAGNPLNKRAAGQIEELKKLGARVETK